MGVVLKREVYKQMCLQTIQLFNSKHREQERLQTESVTGKIRKIGDRNLLDMHFGGQLNSDII